MTVPTTDLYFESHITLDPVKDEDIQDYENACAQNGFRPATLLMQKTKDPSKLDTFCTARSKDWIEIQAKTFNLVQELRHMGFVVRRYKIENTLLDVRL